MQTVSIIIPSFNAKGLLKENIPVLYAQVQQGQPLYSYEIIVVDDGSTDGTAEFVQENFSFCKLVVLDKNYGFSYAINRGVLEAGADIIYLLNSDVKVCAGFLKPLLAHFQDKDVFAVSSYDISETGDMAHSQHKTNIPLVKFKFGIFWYWYAPFKNLELNPVETYCVSGGHTAYDRQKFLSLNGYDPLFKPIYGEDGDICWRAWKRGWKSLVEPKSMVRHESRGTMGKLHSLFSLQKIHWKNRFLVTWKNITAKPLFLKHLLFLMPELFICPFIGKKEFSLGFFAALKQLPDLIKARRRDRIDNEVYSDRALFKRFSRLPQTAPFKILYLHETAKLSGAEESLFNLVFFLDKDIFEPFFILPEEGKLSRKLQQIGVKLFIVALPKIRGIRGVIPALRKIMRIASDNNIQLLHTNSIRTHMYGAYVAKSKNIPIIWHERNLIIREIIDPDRVFLFLPNKIICNSYAIMKRFIRNNRIEDNPESKITVVYNGVDLVRFNPKINGNEIREKFGIGQDEVVVGIASRLGPPKCHHIFFRAAQIVLNDKRYRRDNIRFLIAGDAVFDKDKWREAYLKKFVQDLGIAQRVIFLGFCDDMPKVFAAMDIFVLASDAEACGRVLLEAMACAKPIVATGSGGTPEIVKSGLTGILVPPRNPKALAKAINELLDDKTKRLEMGEAGRKRAEALFRIEENVQKITREYDKLLKQ